MEANDIILKGEKHSPIEAYIVVVILVIATIIMTMEIVSRYFFSYSFGWSEEIVRYSFVWFTLLGASYASKENKHIRLTMVVDYLPKKSAIYTKYMCEIICLISTIYVCYLSAKYCLFISKTGQSSTIIEVPMLYVYAAIPIGFLMMSIRIVQQLVSSFKKKGN